MIYDITMRAILIAITILTFLSIQTPFTYAQVEDSNQLIEMEEGTTEDIEEVVQPSVSPILIIISLIGIGLFLFLGYTLIKRFNL